MRILIIGAVAAGTSAAAKASREDPSAEIVIYERGRHISYSSCNMPYAIAGIISDPSSLHPRGPEFFKEKYGVDVRIEHEVIALDRDAKQLTIRDLSTGREFTDYYDRLVLATGASTITPPIQGSDLPHVFELRTIADMQNILTYMDEEDPQQAVIIGSGFVGMEMAESLVGRGLDVTVLERSRQVATTFDTDMAARIENEMAQHCGAIRTGVVTSSITPTDVRLDDGTEISADLVIMATGVKPEVDLAQAAGIVLGAEGAIAVDDELRTNDPDIYACGDCAENTHMVSGEKVWRPLGSTANKMGRIVGANITGGSERYRGTCGTAIYRLFDLAVGSTGIIDREARELGYDTACVTYEGTSKSSTFGGGDLIIKAVSCRATRKLLGVQIMGEDGVDKRIDVFATALAAGMTADDLEHLDLAYAPPFSFARDAVHYAGMMLVKELGEEPEA